MEARMNRAKGNMSYWVDYTWNPIRGCQYDCSYCYLKSIPGFDFTPRLVQKELNVKHPEHSIIFVGSTADMFGDFVPSDWIKEVLDKCIGYNNVYIFQSKNPKRFSEFVDYFRYNKDYETIPIVGTTIETNREYNISNAPSVIERSERMNHLPHVFRRDVIYRFVSIEPIMDFDIGELVNLVLDCHPSWVNIGADSKNHKLPKPDRLKVEKLIVALERYVEVRLKSNIIHI